MQAVPGLVELHQVRGERRVAEGVERTTHAQLLLPGPQAGGVEGVPGLPGAHRARGGARPSPGASTVSCLRRRI